MLATVALGIGVVVAGLGIGAFISAMQSKGSTRVTTSATTTSTAIVTPVPQSTLAPLDAATVVPHPRLTPSPAAVAVATPSAAPTPSPAPSVTIAPPPSAAPTPSLAPTPKAPPTQPAPPRVTVPPHPTATLRAVVSPPSPAPRAIATPAAVAARPVPEATGIGAVAQTAVRRYLGDLMTGDESAAYAALGKAPGDPGASLDEEAFIDRTTRIASMRTTAVDATGATVEAQIESDRGTYYATYHVSTGPSGPVIDQHDYIKV